MAIIAQRYSGFFTGHPYTFDQQAPYQTVDDSVTHTMLMRGIHIDKRKRWKEPVVIADDCEFCQHLDDESAVRRVAGYQHQIDIEILRGTKTRFYRQWLEACGPTVVDVREGEDTKIGIIESAANMRAFIAETQDKPRKTEKGKERPTGWRYKSLPMVDLPLRLKRKLCIEWNHVYRDYLKEHPGVYYDFEKRAFFVEMPDLGPAECCGGMQHYNMYGTVSVLHQKGCENVPLAPVQTELGYGILAMIIALHGSESGVLNG